MTGEVYADPCSDQPVVKENPAQYHCPVEYPGAKWFADHHFCLPLYPGLSGAETRYVADTLKNYGKKTVTC